MLIRLAGALVVALAVAVVMPETGAILESSAQQPASAQAAPYAAAPYASTAPGLASSAATRARKNSGSHRSSEPR